MIKGLELNEMNIKHTCRMKCVKFIYKMYEMYKMYK